MIAQKVRVRESKLFINQIIASLVKSYRISGSQKTNIRDNRGVAPGCAITIRRYVYEKVYITDTFFMCFRKGLAPLSLILSTT